MTKNINYDKNINSKQKTALSRYILHFLLMTPCEVKKYASDIVFKVIEKQCVK